MRRSVVANMGGLGSVLPPLKTPRPGNKKAALMKSMNIGSIGELAST